MTDTEILNEIQRLTDHISLNPSDADALMQRGSLLWKLDRRGQAISDFNSAAAIDPDGPGAAAAAHAMQIMNFFNPDLLNP